MSFVQRSALDWSRGSSRRSGGGKGQLDWSRSSSKRSGGEGGGGNGGRTLGFDLDCSSSSVANNPQVKVRRIIRHMSGLVADPIELDLDQRRLQNAVREVGEHSFGVAAISVWMVNEDNGKLFMPAGGWWRSPEMDRDGGNVALARLEGCTRDNYVPPKPVSPGTDIAGILWAESKGGNHPLSRRRSSVFDSGLSLKSLDQPQDASSALNYQLIRWRDIPSINLDPDSATGPRLKLMEEAGFTLAAGIVFQYLHHQGMVIFLTTAKDKNDEMLTCVSNSAYLYQAAQLIGATLSFSEIRRASLAERHKLKEACYDMHKYKEDSQETEELEEGTARIVSLVDGNIMSVTTGIKSHILPRMMAWPGKMKGGSMQAPPSLSWKQTLWTILGSFVGLLVLSSLNEYYRILSGDEYYLLIGPFGAMCTLMYGLSSAPASQPRNAVVGQAVAGAVSLAFTYIPTHYMPVWLRTAVGPAFAIGAMVKLGIVHPPAGAHSVLYASGKYNFAFYALVVLSTAISVIPATLVNNMSTKRQYPTFWGISDLGPRLRLAFSCFPQLVGLHNPKGSNSTYNAKTIELDESDVKLDESKRSGNKVVPNRLVIHEEDEEDGNDIGSTTFALDVHITENTEEPKIVAAEAK